MQEYESYVPTDEINTLGLWAKHMLDQYHAIISICIFHYFVFAAL